MIITVYHSQSDDQSECTNQTAEIVLQYALEEALNADFINFLSAFKQMFNNNINTFTDQILNEIIYEFNLANSFSVIINNNAKKIQERAQDSLAENSEFNHMNKSYYKELL